MFFLGYSFTTDNYSIRTTPPLVIEANSVTIQNGVFDDLYITRNTTPPISNEISDIWDYDTILYAKFQGNLFAGNVNFRLEDTNSVRIKRRMKDSFEWVYLFDIPTYRIEDFSFVKYDPTVRSKTEYEYALVPVSGSVEGSYIVNKVYVQFDGLFIMERELFFSTIIEVKFNEQQRNRADQSFQQWARNIHS